MSEPVISVMLEELVDTLRTEVPDLSARIHYGPPNSAPTQTSAWVEYTGTNIEWGNFEVCLHNVRIVVMTPDNGSDYRSRYKLVTDYAQALRHATRANYVLADAATLVEVTQQGATSAQFNGTAVVTATVTLVYETKTFLVDVIEG